MSAPDLTDSKPATGEPAAPTGRARNSRLVLGIAIAALLFAGLIIAVLALSLGLVLGTDEIAEAPVTTEAPAETPEPTIPATVATTEAIATTTVAVPAETCSAAGMSVPRSQPELPAVVASTRLAVIEAALACDYDALAALMSDDFVASQGGSDPIDLWRSQEANGSTPMAELVAVFSQPHGFITSDDGPEDARGPQSFHVWPNAATFGTWDEVPAGDKQALTEIYSTEDIESFEQIGWYGGYRVGLDDAGQWRYFVAAD